MNAQMQDHPRQLLPIEHVNAVELFTGHKLDELLLQIRAETASIVPDTSTDAGRKAIASTAYKVARSKTAIDDAGKELVAGWKRQAAEVDAGRKKARDYLDDLKIEVRAPLDAWEAEQARLEQEARIQREQAEADRLAEIERREAELRQREEAIAAQERAAQERAERERIDAEQQEQARLEQARIDEQARQEAVQRVRDRVAQAERAEIVAAAEAMGAAHYATSPSPDMRIEATTITSAPLDGSASEAPTSATPETITPTPYDDRRNLLRFAAAVMEDWHEGDLDGGYRQDLAVKHGLLRVVRVGAPCGEECLCAEYGDFPQDCYQPTSLLREARMVQLP